jgi:hypothetical protein
MKSIFNFSFMLLFAFAASGQNANVAIIAETPLADGSTELTALVTVTNTTETTLSLAIEYDKNIVKTGSIIAVNCPTAWSKTVSDDRANGTLYLNLSAATSSTTPEVATLNIVVDNVQERNTNSPKPKVFGLSASIKPITKAVISPNQVASNGSFTIAISEGELQAVAIYNTQGCLLQTEQISGNTGFIMLHSFAAGVYFVAIQSTKGVETQGITVRH